MSNKNIGGKDTVTESKPRFNVADVVILVIIASVIIAFGLRIYNVFDSSDTCKVRVSFEVYGVSAESVTVKEGDVLYSVADDSKAGFVESVSISDCVTYAYDENGAPVTAKVPGKITVTGTIVLDCADTDGRFYLGNDLLTVGKNLSLYTAEREMNYEIISIEPISEP